MDILKFPCLIIGMGAGGLVSGINFIENWNSESKNSCLIVGNKFSNSMISPWNIMIKEPEQIKEMILKSGDNLSDKSVLDKFVLNYNKIIPFLNKMEIPLRDSNLGKVPLIKGSECVEKLLSKFKLLGGDVLNGEVINFLYDGKRVCGVIVKNSEGNKKIIADQIILSSGGLLNLYEYTTGPNTNKHNLIALANTSNIRVDNLEFNMFHPFLIVDKNLPKALVSGELLQKAIYVNEQGEEFLSEEIKLALRNNKHHGKFPLMTKEFYLESLKSKIYMDISENSSEYFENYKKENEFGWVFKDKSFEEVKKFEIHPAFHFSIGGIKIDEFAETNQEGVYAVGEVSCGLHGSNRIGGFAISECIIFGEIAGKLAASRAKFPSEHNFEIMGNSFISDDLKKMVWENLGPVKNTKNLLKFKDNLESKKEKSCEENLVLKMVNLSLARGNIGTNFKLD